MIYRGNVNSWAQFSECDRYRYALGRQWGDGPNALFVMLNPSTADEYVLDPTLRRCQNYAEQWGFDGFLVCNLFALRSTDPRVMLRDPEPIGPENDAYIRLTAEACDMIVCGWGNHGTHMGRAGEVMEILRSAGEEKIHALSVTKSGQPGHPLYLRADLKPFRVQDAPIGDGSSRV
jgi:hypothetical protein